MMEMVGLRVPRPILLVYLRRLVRCSASHPLYPPNFVQSAFMTKYFPQPSADEVANEAKRSKTLADFFPDSQPLSLNAFLEVSTHWRSGHGVLEHFSRRPSNIFTPLVCIGPDERKHRQALQSIHQVDRPTLGALR